MPDNEFDVIEREAMRTDCQARVLTSRRSSGYGGSWLILVACQAAQGRLAIKALPTDRYLKDLGVTDLGIYFPGDMTATNLLATGIVEVRKDLDQVALGALLHMLQDSFSQAHAERGAEPGGSCAGTSYGRPGKILRFYSYARQQGRLHDHEDSFEALRLHSIQSSPSVIEASRTLIDLAQRKVAWIDAEKVLDCLFELHNVDEPAAPGRFAGN